MTMNHSHPVPPGHPPGGLDRLLSDFFKNELPRPWPALRAAAEPAGLARERAGAARRSRYALAASVAALLGLGALLSSAVPGGTPNPANVNPDVLKKAEATGDNLIKNANPMPGGHDPMGVSNMP